jgi:hypothetical protein
MKIYIHINRHELRKGKRGKPWTLHTSKGCIAAREVVVDPKAGDVRAQCFPERPRNPKCFLVVEDAKIRDLGKGRFRIAPKNEPGRAIAGPSRKGTTVAELYGRLIGPAKQHLYK